MGITELIAAGKEFGIFEFYLPFILMFAVLYGILQKIQIFGDKGKGINIIISIASSVFVMAYTPAGVVLSQFFANLFGQALVVILSLIVFMVILSIVTGKQITEIFSKGWIAIPILAVVTLATGVFFASGGSAFFPGIKIPGISLPSFGISPQTLAIILVVVITGVIIYFLTKEKKAAAGTT